MVAEGERRRPWVVAFSLLIGFVIYSAFSEWGFDDPFITYRYADNLRRGLGFVYNPGERVLSTTTPLFALLLAGLEILWSDLPHMAILVGAFSLVLGALFLWDLAHTWQTPWVGWAGLVFYPFFALSLGTLGSEMPLYLAFCLGAFAFYARGRYLMTAGFIALAMLSRPDGALIAVILAAHYLLVVRRPIPWPAILLFLGMTLPWFLFATFYFGSAVPATLAAKQHQGLMAISQRFAPGLLTIVARGYASRWQYWLAAALGLVGILSLTRRARPWVLFFVWTALYFVSYSVLGVTRYFWYYAPLVPGFIVAAGLGAEALAAVWKRALPSARFTFRLLGAIGLLGLVLGLVAHAFELNRHPDSRLLIYRAAGEWLQSNTGQESSVGALEVGIIGYYSQRKMIDFAGLIQPAIAERLTLSTTYEDSSRWGILTYRPDYLVLNPAWFPDLTREVITPHCGLQEIFHGEEYGYDGDLAIYQCTWPESRRGELLPRPSTS